MCSWWRHACLHAHTHTHTVPTAGYNWGHCCLCISTVDLCLWEKDKETEAHLLAIVSCWRLLHFLPSLYLPLCLSVCPLLPAGSVWTERACVYNTNCHTHTRIHTHTHICTHTYTYIHTPTHTYTHSHSDSCCFSVCVELGGACRKTGSTVWCCWSVWTLPPWYLPQRPATGDCQVTPHSVCQSLSVNMTCVLIPSPLCQVYGLFHGQSELCGIME